MAVYLAGMVVVGAWLALTSVQDPASTAYFEAQGLEPWSVRAGVVMLALVWPLAIVLLARQALRRG
ncbi:MAG: hypothetical protein QOE76_3926 [Frankiales bacterium]|jgi:hypothetical protein|nr:hypothetical protein [Frankiales bacterium]MDX6246203.1 hypothetical protein [Frankiales bacterium]